VVISLVRVELPGQALCLVAGGAGGPLYAASYGPGAALAVDLAGRILWCRRLENRLRCRLPARAGDAGTVWLALAGGQGPVLQEIGPDGGDLRQITMAGREEQVLEAFVLLPDGFCTAWTSGPPYHGARVDRLDTKGAAIWSTAIPPEPFAHPGLVEAGAHTGSEIRPVRPWLPTHVRLSFSEPLLASGDRILASYWDMLSGLGVSYFLDADSGQVVASTRPAPVGCLAVLGTGQFLIGSEGYGEFTTVRYDRNGAEVTRWPSHGAMVVDRHGAIRGAEREDALPSRSRFCTLEPDGTVTRGPALSGCYTAHPALDRNGTAVFFRDGRLVSVDARFRLEDLFHVRAPNAAMGRILLLDGGIVAFTLGGELLIFRTGLAALEESIWPCGDGNVQGNPVCRFG
jgi:hypothetical protein